MLNPVKNHMIQQTQTKEVMTASPVFRQLLTKLWTKTHLQQTLAPLKIAQPQLAPLKIAPKEKARTKKTKSRKRKLEETDRQLDKSISSLNESIKRLSP